MVKPLIPLNKSSAICGHGYWNTATRVGVKVGWSSLTVFYLRSNGFQIGNKRTKIYVDNAEVAAIESAAEARRIAANEEFERDKKQREIDRANDPRTPLLDEFYMQSHDWHKLTLEQLQQLKSWLA